MYENTIEVLKHLHNVEQKLIDSRVTIHNLKYSERSDYVDKLLDLEYERRDMLINDYLYVYDFICHLIHSGYGELSNVFAKDIVKVYKDYKVDTLDRFGFLKEQGERLSAFVRI